MHYTWLLTLLLVFRLVQSVLFPLKHAPACHITSATAEASDSDPHRSLAVSIQSGFLELLFPSSSVWVTHELQGATGTAVLLKPRLESPSSPNNREHNYSEFFILFILIFHFHFESYICVICVYIYIYVCVLSCGC